MRSERARLLTILAPLGFEGFYREMGEVEGMRGNGDTPASPSALTRLVTMAARYGCEITGPARGAGSDLDNMDDVTASP